MKSRTRSLFTVVFFAFVFPSAEGGWEWLTNIGRGSAAGQLSRQVGQLERLSIAGRIQPQDGQRVSNWQVTFAPAVCAILPVTEAAQMNVFGRVATVDEQEELELVRRALGKLRPAVSWDVETVSAFSDVLAANPQRLAILIGHNEGSALRLAGETIRLRNALELAKGRGKELIILSCNTEPYLTKTEIGVMQSLTPAEAALIAIDLTIYAVNYHSRHGREPTVLELKENCIPGIAAKRRLKIAAFFVSPHGKLTPDPSAALVIQRFA